MYQNNFQPVLYAMIDPDARVIVTVGKPRIDEPYYIDVTFDPEIERHRMTVAMPEVQAAIWVRHNNAPPPPVIFKSGRQEILAQFSVTDRINGCRLELSINEHDKPLSFYGYTDAVSDKGFLPAVLGAALELREWDSLSAGGASSIAMFVGPHTAKRLRSAGLIAEEPSNTTQALFRQRPVRSQ